GEDGRGTLLLVMAGWRHWVLGAWKISTERAELRALIGSVSERCHQQLRGITDTCVSADEEPGVCPVCGGDRWFVQKSSARHGKTLSHGQFEARETVRVCAAGCHHSGGLLVSRGAASLAKHLLPASVVGYDVMARVGLERFLRHRQRQEICTLIEEEAGIRISTGEVSALARRFVGRGWPRHAAVGDGGLAPLGTGSVEDLHRKSRAHLALSA
ncbi:MAG: hypothetical protein P8Y25_12630, partial [Chromatiaceae bacterium]